jgi:CRISPR/Cas system CSM-associated protein Csm2 small subunit
MNTNLEVIDFSYNWNNKLNCKAFTTFRLHSNKYGVGRIYEVQLKSETLGTATLQNKKTIKLNQINDYISYLDTGYNVDEMKNIVRKMYKNSNINCETQLFDFCLFKYTENKPKSNNTNTLF